SETFLRALGFEHDRFGKPVSTFPDHAVIRKHRRRAPPSTGASKTHRAILSPKCGVIVAASSGRRETQQPCANTRSADSARKRTHVICRLLNMATTSRRGRCAATLA